jgi:hypothetical protein
VNNNSSHTYGVPKLRNQYNPLESIDCFMRQGGGGDDDKPIIMHIVEGAGRIPVPGAELIMISNTDTLQQTTDSEGHCYFELLRKGHWELIVLQEGFYPYATQVSITDTFHVFNSILQPR